MDSIMSEKSSETDDLLKRAAEGNQESWGALLARHSQRLRRLVAFRMDQRLQGRIDPSDVLQEAYLEAWAHLADYFRQPELPFYLWLRGIAGNRTPGLHFPGFFLGRREVSINRGTMPEASSAALAAHLLGHGTRPSEAAVRAEIKVRLQEALNHMDPLDREVLALRHFEQLSPRETAQVLDVKEKAAGMRYVRALRRLRTILSNLPGGMLEP